MVNLNSITSKVHGSDITLTRECPFCGEEHSITIKLVTYNAGLNALKTRARIQDAFPQLTPDEREFIQTGICPKCWENM